MKKGSPSQPQPAGGAAAVQPAQPGESSQVEALLNCVRELEAANASMAVRQSASPPLPPGAPHGGIPAPPSAVPVSCYEELAREHSALAHEVARVQQHEREAEARLSYMEEARQAAMSAADANEVRPQHGGNPLCVCLCLQLRSGGWSIGTRETRTCFSQMCEIGLSTLASMLGAVY